MQASHVMTGKLPKRHVIRRTLIRSSRDAGSSQGRPRSLSVARSCSSRVASSTVRSVNKYRMVVSPGTSIAVKFACSGRAVGDPRVRPCGLVGSRRAVSFRHQSGSGFACISNMALRKNLCWEASTPSWAKTTSAASRIPSRCRPPPPEASAWTKISLRTIQGSDMPDHTGFLFHDDNVHTLSRAATGVQGSEIESCVTGGHIRQLTQLRSRRRSRPVVFFLPPAGIKTRMTRDGVKGDLGTEEGKHRHVTDWAV